MLTGSLPIVGDIHQGAPAQRANAAERRLFDGYRPYPGSFDEWFGPAAGGAPYAGRAALAFASLDPRELARRQSLAERELLEKDVTFSVYSDRRGTEKIFPFCLLPRPLCARDWAKVERGLAQRVTALEEFLRDVYGRGLILAERPLIREMVTSAKGYDPRLSVFLPPGSTRIHVAGIDLVRNPQGDFLVLEDNLRTPSGVSYVLMNRLTTRNVLGREFDGASVRPVDDYPLRLAEALRALAPRHAGPEPNVVVLTPGPFNSAYFEHAFLARTTGFPLVEPSDLFVRGGEVFVHTMQGARPVHVIYRRVDDAYLDPEFFRADSLLGVRGLMRAYGRGRVTIANAPGNGIADDKGLYPFVPEIIRYYLGEEPLIEQVPTYICSREDDRKYVAQHMGELVIKAVDEAGGYGMLMGPRSTAAERSEFCARIAAEPRKYIAQPRVELSTCPTWDAERKRVVPRRVDLRPYVVGGPDGLFVLPGGLTRVALREGSYVVNSSQGGGSKDTWVER